MVHAMKRGNAAAGVGVMWKEDGVKIFPEKMKDHDLRKASEGGRTGKYTMSLGWEKSYTCYPIYKKVRRD